MSLGILALAVLLVVVAIVVVVLATRSRSDDESGDEGGGNLLRVLLFVVALLLILGVVAALVGAFFFATLAGAPYVALAPPDPNVLVVVASGARADCDELADAALDPARLCAHGDVSVDAPNSSSMSSSSFMSEWSQARTPIRFRGALDDSTPDDALDDPLDFDAFLAEYDLALASRLDDTDPSQDLSIVVGYRSGDGSEVRAAELRWVDGEPTFVEVAIEEAFDSTFATADEVDTEPVLEPLEPSSPESDPAPGAAGSR